MHQSSSIWHMMPDKLSSINYVLDWLGGVITQAIMCDNQLFEFHEEHYLVCQLQPMLTSMLPPMPANPTPIARSNDHIKIDRISF